MIVRSLIVVLGVLALVVIVLRAIQNRRKMKPLMDEAVDQFKKHRLVTAGSTTIPLAALREVRAEARQLSYVRTDGPDVVLGYDLAGPIEIAVLRQMGASVSSIFGFRGWNGTTLWRAPAVEPISTR